MTVTLVKGLVGQRPGQQGSNPAQSSTSQAQAASVNAASAHAIRQAGDAAVLRLSSHSTFPSDKIRDPDKAQESADKLADDIRSGGDPDGSEVHAGLSPATARGHVAG
jgi:hypothetical protein